MRCSVKDILVNDGDTTEISGSIEYETLENNGDIITFITPIEFSGELRNDNGDINVKGEIEFEYKVKCHRCGEEFTSSLKCDVEEIYSAIQTDSSYLLKGDEIDLKDMIIDNIHLNLPIKFLCKDDCKGVCTICGTNLNYKSCNCKKTETDPRLSVLTELLK